MSNEETKEAVVEETKAEETKVEDTAAETTEEELSPWYVFCSQGCGFCKKAEPIYEELNASGKYPEILKLDMAEPDNQKLNKELQAEFGIQCGTPWFINAETGESICGYREKDVLIKWLNGEHIPEPPRMKSQMPKIPFDGASKKEEKAWTETYNNWLKEHEHMGEDWNSKQRSAEEILEAPRPKSDPPKPPMGAALTNATDETIDNWGKEYGKWAEDNQHLPGIQSVEQIVQQIKTRRAQMQAQNFQNGAPSGAGGALSPDQNARINRLEQKLDKLMKHMGVK